MHEQGGGFALTGVTWAGRKMGQGTALVDEDMLRVLLLDAPDGDKSIQLRYDAIIGVGLADNAVVVTCRDGRALTVATREATGFRAAVLAACRALPEVTRALRALGSRRVTAGARRSPGKEEASFFQPFISARRASMDARDAASVIAAFDTDLLAEGVAATIVAFAAARSAGHPARQRALEAELSDATEDLASALDTLEALAASAMADVDDLARWRSWAAGVQHVFEVADRAWVEIDSIVSSR